jgi:transcriptional regulator with XRE-family HTH domain
MLKELRQNRNLTLKEVAVAIGVKLQAISHYEKNIRMPSIQIITKLSKFYGVPRDELIDYFCKGAK